MYDNMFDYQFDQAVEDLEREKNGEKHRFGDLDEVTAAFAEKWIGKLLEEIPDTPDNRELVDEGLFWCGVNMVRFTFDHKWVRDWMTIFCELKRRWSEEKENA